MGLISATSGLGSVGILTFLVSCSGGSSSSSEPAANPYVWIDTHVHLDAYYLALGSWESDYGTASATAIAAMDTIGVETSLLMPPPQTPGHEPAYDYTDLLSVVATAPSRFGFLGGGGLLNPAIQEAIDAGTVSAAALTSFQDDAATILAAGAAGFGEMAALPLSFIDNHPYVAAPPDHPLFLALADIAASEGVPIDLHMEAVLTDMTLPAGFAIPPNPTTLTANMAQFENLLVYNRGAKIVWVHVGWDNTGDMTVGLLRDLLEAHSNLYMSLKIVDGVGLQVEANRPIDSAGNLRSEWISLISDFSDRFVMGADEFFGVPGVTPTRPESTQATYDGLNQLPDDVVRKVVYDNVRALYRL